MKIKTSIAASLGLAFIATSPLAHADTVTDAVTHVRQGDLAGAVKLLEEASAKGDVAAKAQLASYLRAFPPPLRDAARGCVLAHEAADAGDPLAALTRVECLITGAEKANEPFSLARQIARKASAKDPSWGGLGLYETFLLDPKYSYRPDGKVDMNKYNALAATPVAQRSEQTEALNGLAAAVTKGHEGAVRATLAYFTETAGPRNLDRTIRLAELMQGAKIMIPPQQENDLKLARTIKQMGGTQASLLIFKNAYGSAQQAAFFQLTGLGKNGCDGKDIKIVKTEAGAPVADAVYLPLNQPLENSYLVQGSWTESWTFAGCGKTAVIQMTFNADGWGGATYRSNGVKPQ